MGIELDVLVGHPEHELLFVATQVARAAGLKNPSNCATTYAKHGQVLALRIYEVPEWQCLPLNGRPDLQARSWLFTESLVYRMLLGGRSPQSEPFRKWVTEEVLPTIRKTGKYDAEQSTNPAVLRT
jgi:prophage antirepressor-like protein